VAAQQAAAIDVPEARPGVTCSVVGVINCQHVRARRERRVSAPTHTPHEPSELGRSPNTPENLRAWVNDPASLKLGALMPAMKVSGNDWTARAYLVTLR